MMYIYRLSLVVLCFMSLFSNTMQLDWGMAARMGRRNGMEDAHVHLYPFDNDAHQAFFGIYDGHGGIAAANRTAERLHHIFLECRKKAASIEDALKQAFRTMDQEICDAKIDVGTTAVVVYIDKSVAHIAWLGDARAIVVRNKQVVAATIDQKIDKAEKERIEELGGEVHQGRINRSLIVSRALGDRKFKPYVIAEGNYLQVPLQHDDQIVLGCDGVWDVIQNEAIPGLLASKDTIEFTQTSHEQFTNNYIPFMAGNNQALQNRACFVRERSLPSNDNISVGIIKITSVPPMTTAPSHEPVKQDAQATAQGVQSDTITAPESSITPELPVTSVTTPTVIQDTTAHGHTPPVDHLAAVAKPKVPMSLLLGGILAVVASGCVYYWYQSYYAEKSQKIEEEIE